MKKSFPEYFKSSEEDRSNLWKAAHFVFDANFLLNIYRYSEETRNELYGIIKELSERIWLSNHATLEFLKNRLAVISKQVESYDQIIKDCKTIEDNFKNANQHPFVSKTVLDKLLNIFDEVRTDLSKRKETYCNFIEKDDSILEEITKLFDGKIGESFPEKEIEALKKEGERRFKEKIPPGYKDASKAVNKYGDLILWKEIIAYAKEKEIDIVFITDDRKNDWWLYNKVKDYPRKTISPRPELISEFRKNTNKNFHMYHADRFMKFAKQYLKPEIKEETINEVKEVRKQDEDKRAKYISNYSSLLSSMPDYKNLLSSMPDYKNILDSTPDYTNLLKNIPDFKNIANSLPDYSSIIKSMPDLSTYSSMFDSISSSANFVSPLSGVFSIENEILGLSSDEDDMDNTEDKEEFNDDSDDGDNK